MYYLYGSRSQSMLPSLEPINITPSYPSKVAHNNLSHLFNPEANETETAKRLTKDVSVPNLVSVERIRDVNLGLMKNILNQSYSKQISEKTNEQSLSRKAKIMQQNDYLSQFQKHRDFQNRANKQQKEQYRNELLTEMKEKQIVIESVKTQEKELERIYQEPRQRSLRHKSQAYEQFYQQAKKYQKQVERQYIDYMKVQQIFEKAKNKDKISNYERNFSLVNHHKEQESKLSNMRRQNLKKTLEQQMKVNEQKNRYRPADRGDPLGLKARHNTILNPIDFKMDMNNKYILSQITRKI